MPTLRNRVVIFTIDTIYTTRPLSLFKRRFRQNKFTITIDTIYTIDTEIVNKNHILKLLYSQTKLCDKVSGNTDTIITYLSNKFGFPNMET